MTVLITYMWFVRGVAILLQVNSYQHKILLLPWKRLMPLNFHRLSVNSSSWRKNKLFGMEKVTFICPIKIHSGLAEQGCSAALPFPVLSWTALAACQKSNWTQTFRFLTLCSQNTPLTWLHGGAARGTFKLRLNALPHLGSLGDKSLFLKALLLQPCQGIHSASASRTVSREASHKPTGIQLFSYSFINAWGHCNTGKGKTSSSGQFHTRWLLSCILFTAHSHTSMPHLGRENGLNRQPFSYFWRAWLGSFENLPVFFFRHNIYLHVS